MSVKKYAYIKPYAKEEPFCRETGKSIHKECNTRANGYGFDIYLYEQDWKDEHLAFKEKKRLQERLLDSWSRLFDFPPDVVNKIHAVLDDAGIE